MTSLNPVVMLLLFVAHLLALALTLSVFILALWQQPGDRLGHSVTQFLAALGRHLPELVKPIAHMLLLFRRQTLELLPALSKQLALFRRHRTPLIEPLLRARPLLRRHSEPAIAAPGEGLLALRRQAVPVVAIPLQQLLLLRRQRLPIVRRHGRSTGRASCARRRRTNRASRVRGASGAIGGNGLGKTNPRRRQCEDCGKRNCSNVYPCLDHLFVPCAAVCGGGARGAVFSK